MKKIISIAIAFVLCFTITVSAVGLLKPTMEITVQGGVYTIEITGLTRSQSQDIEKMINDYLDDSDDCDNDDSYEDVEVEPSAIVYLVKNNKLYHIEDGKENYIDTVCDGEIGVDKYNNVVYINEDYKAKYIYNTNEYPTKTKSITSKAKNLVNDDYVVTGVDFASGNYTKTNTSFIKDSKNELPVVIYEQVKTQLMVKKLGEYIRISSSIYTKAENPIAVTSDGNIVYIVPLGYAYEIENVENLTKIKSTTPSRLSIRSVEDIVIEDGTATKFLKKNGTYTEIG